MQINRRQGLKGIVGSALGGMLGSAAFPTGSFAQSRTETLRHVTGGQVTSLDPTTLGTLPLSYQLSGNVYDRLLGVDRNPVPGGYVFSLDKIRGELAERFDVSPDGRKITLHIREGATWHDGRQVEVDDVKWSLDRAVSAASNGKAQMTNGSMTNVDQFKVAGPRQIEISLEKPDRLALATLTTPFLVMYNSRLAKEHASSDDPWATNWLKENTAAGGAYVVDSHKAGQQTALRRNDKWKNGRDGALPYFTRVLVQTIPDATTRANLLERGDADLTLDAASSDIEGIEKRGQAKVFSTPIPSGFNCIGFNTTIAPFNDPRVRQAVSWALPYDAAFKVAQFGRGKPLYGATWADPPTTQFPQPMPYASNIERAKALLQEAGLSNGFKTVFSFGVSFSPQAEPLSALVKEALGKLNIDVTVQKLPDPQLVTMLTERRTGGMFFDFLLAWLGRPEYFARVYYQGTDRWNGPGYNNPEVVKLAQEARYELDPAAYDSKAKRFIKIVSEDVPYALLWQPNHDAVMAKNIEGYTLNYYRGADYRDLKRV